MSNNDFIPNYSAPEFTPSTQATTLTVVLHAYGSSSEKMAKAGVTTAVKEALGQDSVDVYCPTLPYADTLDATGADEIVLALVRRLDEIWSQKPGGYEKVVFIGHTLGGLILRRVFLAGSLNPPDYDNAFKARDDLYDEILAQRKAHRKSQKLENVEDAKLLPCEWAPKVERLLLLATWDKGWNVSPRTSWRYSIGLNALGVVGRIIELVEPLFEHSGPKQNSSQTSSRDSLLSKVRGVLSKIMDALANMKPGRTMLDMRQGAPFIVQTRLLWMAYRRWHNDELRAKYNEHDLGVRLDNPAKKIQDGKKLTANPLVVQIIGSQDDFVFPQEQVDIDAEGMMAWSPRPAESAKTSEKKKYFLLEMEFSDHAAVIDFDDNEEDKAPRELIEVKKARKQLFIAALKTAQDEFETAPKDSKIAKALRNPVNFLDAPPEIDEDARHVVFVMHGIRDDGSWTHRVAAAIKREWAKQKEKGQASKVLASAADASTPESSQVDSQTKSEREAIKFYPSWTHTYGYFPMLPFILPWIRKSKVEWFMDKYVSVKAAYPTAKLHYVGHSNGTYIAATALDQYPAARFDKIYFAGSVVHPRFDWAEKYRNKQVESFHNARGGEDWVVALLPKSLEYFSDLGGAGFDGFDETADKAGQFTWPAQPKKFSQSRLFATGGHGGAIGEKHWDEIAKFIVHTDYQPFGLNEPEGALFSKEQDRFFKFFGGLRIGVPLGFALAGLLFLLAAWLFLPDHWSLEGTVITILWGCWLAATGCYLKDSSATPPPPPTTTPAFYAMAGHAMAGGAVILSVVSPIVLVDNFSGWIWAAGLVVFMDLQHRSKGVGWSRTTDQQAGRIQRTLTHVAEKSLTKLFLVLTASFVAWWIWSIYAELAEYAHFGQCVIDLKAWIFLCTLLFVFGELAIFVTLLHHSQLAPPWLEKDFPKRFIYAAVGVLAAWGGVIWLIYHPYSQLCPDQFITLLSGFAVATLFLLAGMIRFILLRL